MKHVVILGAGFAGLELTACLSESLAGEARTTLIDQNAAFTFGFSKLDILFGRKTKEDVLLYYRDLAKEGVDFRQERVTEIDPESRRVATDAGTYDADILVVNTCAFIDEAKQESIDAILEMAQLKETSKAQRRAKRLVVTGCLGERYRDELRNEIPEIDAVLGTGEVPEIIAAIGGATTNGAEPMITSSILPRPRTPWTT